MKQTFCFSSLVHIKGTGQNTVDRVSKAGKKMSVKKMLKNKAQELLGNKKEVVNAVCLRKKRNI